MLKDVNQLIPRQLDRLLKERKLRDIDVLKRCGFTRPTLAKIKNGGNINVDTLVSLANGLGVKIGFFFDEEEVSIEQLQTGNNGTQYHNVDKLELTDNRGSITPASEDIEVKDRLLKLQEKYISLLEENQELKERIRELER